MEVSSPQVCGRLAITPTCGRSQFDGTPECTEGRRWEMAGSEAEETTALTPCPCLQSVGSRCRGPWCAGSEPLSYGE